MSKIALIVRADKSGLGIQTRRLTRMLKPDRVMIIDSTTFNDNKQHYDWYADYESMVIPGFPNDMEVRKFLSGMDTVITCETFYNNRFTIIAGGMGVQTICIANPEFFDWFKPQFVFIPQPNKIIVPSKWMLSEMQSRFNAQYLPTPIFDDEFRDVQKANLTRKVIKPKFLFMNGKTAQEDRNGLESLYAALELSKGEFTVTVKAQHDIKRHPDPRLIYDFTNPEEQKELYNGFDCLIQPRRYGGQTLSMTEALTCAMPVIMTNIDPNDKILLSEWLVSAYKKTTLTTRIEVDVYTAEPIDLAVTLDTIKLDSKAKHKAVLISKQYRADNLRKQYKDLVS